MNTFNPTVLICIIFLANILASRVKSYRLNPENSTNDQNLTRLDPDGIQRLLKAPYSNSKNRYKRQPYEISKPVNVFDTSRVGGLICNLCIVVDDQFVKAYNLKDSPAVVTEIKRLVDRTSWIFRNIDWNNDGIPDNFGFDILNLIQGWNPFPYESEADYKRSKPSLALLGEFAQQDFSTCCLGIGFTNRPFDESQVGVSFIASQQSLGGICDYRLPDQPLKSSNVILISSIGLKGTQLTLKDIGVVLLHELGHTFGVLKHDIDSNAPECSGFGTNDILPADYKSEAVNPPEGRYIMWGQDIQGLKNVKANSLNFSPCSKAKVMELLTSNEGRDSCLVVSQDAFCGNGIVEFPEECDCGNEISCTKIGCCGSRGSNGPCLFFQGIKPTDCQLLKKIGTKHKGGRNCANLFLFRSTHYLLPSLVYFFKSLSVSV